MPPILPEDLYRELEVWESGKFFPPWFFSVVVFFFEPLGVFLGV